MSDADEPVELTAEEEAAQRRVAQERADAECAAAEFVDRLVEAAGAELVDRYLAERAIAYTAAYSIEAVFMAVRISHRGCDDNDYDIGSQLEEEPPPAPIDTLATNILRTKKRRGALDGPKRGSSLLSRPTTKGTVVTTSSSSRPTSSVFASTLTRDANGTRHSLKFSSEIEMLEAQTLVGDVHFMRAGGALFSPREMERRKEILAVLAEHEAAAEQERRLQAIREADEEARKQLQKTVQMLKGKPFTYDHEGNILLISKQKPGQRGGFDVKVRERWEDIIDEDQVAERKKRRLEKIKARNEARAARAAAKAKESMRDPHYKKKTATSLVDKISLAPGVSLTEGSSIMEGGPLTSPDKQKRWQDWNEYDIEGSLGQSPHRQERHPTFSDEEDDDFGADGTDGGGSIASKANSAYGTMRRLDVKDAVEEAPIEVPDEAKVGEDDDDYFLCQAPTWGVNPTPRRAVVPVLVKRKPEREEATALWPPAVKHPRERVFPTQAQLKMSRAKLRAEARAFVLPRETGDGKPRVIMASASAPSLLRYDSRSGSESSSRMGSPSLASLAAGSLDGEPLPPSEMVDVGPVVGPETSSGSRRSSRRSSRKSSRKSSTRSDRSDTSNKSSKSSKERRRKSKSVTITPSVSVEVAMEYRGAVQQTLEERSDDEGPPRTKMSATT